MSPVETRSGLPLDCVDCLQSQTAVPRPRAGKSPRCHEHKVLRDRWATRERQRKYRRLTFRYQQRVPPSPTYVPPPLPTREPTFVFDEDFARRIVRARLAVLECMADCNEALRKTSSEELQPFVEQLLASTHELTVLMRDIPGLIDNED